MIVFLCSEVLVVSQFLSFSTKRSHVSDIFQSQSGLWRSLVAIFGQSAGYISKTFRDFNCVVCNSFLITFTSRRVSADGFPGKQVFFAAFCNLLVVFTFVHVWSEEQLSEENWISCFCTTEFWNFFM